MQGRILDTGFGMDDLHAIATRGMLIEAHAVKTTTGALVCPATLSRSSDGEFFVMTGVTGRHSLAATETDPARLKAHWEGFKLNASNRARA